MSDLELLCYYLNDIGSEWCTLISEFLLRYPNQMKIFSCGKYVLHIFLFLLEDL
jgi:hypothetical protein